MQATLTTRSGNIRIGIGRSYVQNKGCYLFFGPYRQGLGWANGRPVTRYVPQLR